MITSDYAANPKLDRYDPAAIDDDELEAMDPETRALAEARMARRDRREGKAGEGKRQPPTDSVRSRLSLLEHF